VRAEVDAMLAGKDFHDSATARAKANRIVELNFLANLQSRAAQALPEDALGRDDILLSALLMEQFVALQRKKDKGRKVDPTVASFHQLQECWERLRRYFDGERPGEPVADDH
jgi:hypothetical protein